MDNSSTPSSPDPSDPRDLNDTVVQDRGAALASSLLRGQFLNKKDLTAVIPESIGEFKVLRPLAKGGMSEVYLAEDAAKELIAIKLLTRSSPRDIRMFQREVEVLRVLNHPNIIRVLDFGLFDGRPYYAMDYAGERSLADCELDFKECAALMATLARACHAAHSRGIIHRDLKAENILIGERPMIADFGAAKLVDIVSSLTESGTVVGTPATMSPEQLSGGEVSPKSDIYALGVILYEKVTGRLPFSADSFPELILAISTQEAEKPSALRPDLPPALEEIILKAMARKPEDRFQSAEQLALALEQWDETALAKNSSGGCLPSLLFLLLSLTAFLLSLPRID